MSEERIPTPPVPDQGTMTAFEALTLLVQTRDSSGTRSKQLFRLCSHPLYRGRDRENIRQAAILLMKVRLLIEPTINPQHVNDPKCPQSPDHQPPLIG